MSSEGSDSTDVRFERIIDELAEARRRLAGGADLPPSRSAAPSAPPSVPLGVRLRRAARPVASVVVTMTLVLSGWLLVLEPLLGSLPVVITDDGMSPALRIGDVAFVEAPPGPLGTGAIVAVRRDGRIDVSRLIDREPVAGGTGADVPAAAPLVLRDDEEDVSVRVVVESDQLLGVIGAAVPRVGLPVVWLRSPTTAPLGTVLVLLVLAVTVLGLTDGARAWWRRRSAPAHQEHEAEGDADDARDQRPVAAE
jgi:hypothetical protein